MPLDVDRGIELPQLELTHNFTGDCTTAYSTGGSTALLQLYYYNSTILLLYFIFSTELNKDVFNV